MSTTDESYCVIASNPIKIYSGNELWKEVDSEDNIINELQKTVNQLNFDQDYNYNLNRKNENEYVITKYGNKFIVAYDSIFQTFRIVKD